MKKISLKPCPFCGSKALKDYYIIKAGPYWVRCSNDETCAAMGPSSDDWKESIALWNYHRFKK